MLTRTSETKYHKTKCCRIFLWAGFEWASSQDMPNEKMMAVVGEALGRSAQYRLARDGGRIKNIIRMDHLLELDEDMEVVGKRGGPTSRHSFKSLSPLRNLTFSDVEKIEIENVPAARFNFSVSVPGPNAALDVHVILFLGEGNVTIGNETREVANGTFALRIEVGKSRFGRRGFMSTQLLLC